jgi:hypothetical protein
LGPSELKSRFLTQKNPNLKIINSNLPKNPKISISKFPPIVLQKFQSLDRNKLRQSFGDQIYEFCLPD